MGPNIIEDDSETKTQQLRDKMKENGKRYNSPENLNVERYKTYNRPLGRETHGYPTQNIIQQVHKQQRIEERAQLDEPLANEKSLPSLSIQSLITTQERWTSKH